MGTKDNSIHEEGEGKEQRAVCGGGLVVVGEAAVWLKLGLSPSSVEEVVSELLHHGVRVSGNGGDGVCVCGGGGGGNSCLVPKEVIVSHSLAPQGVEWYLAHFGYHICFFIILVFRE